MTELVIQSKILPEPLFRLVRTEKLKVREILGEIHLIPVVEKTGSTACPLLGLFADGKLTVEQHHAWSREDKELER